MTLPSIYVAAATGLLSTLLWLAVTAVYRLYFHPLAQVPGPFWAAVTYLYSFKYNVVGPGSRFYLQIERLHEKYGPVVRITPDEIHLSDPDHYDRIYFLGSGFSKCPGFYGGLGLTTAAFGTASNDLHRVRRAVLNPLFSRKRVLELEEIVQRKVSQLLQRIDESARSGQVVDLHHGFRAVSVDVTTDYAFGDCYNLLERQDLGASFFNMIRDLAPRIWICQQFPFLMPVSKSLPPWLARRMSGHLVTFLAFKENCEREIKTIAKEMKSGQKTTERKRTIFHQLLDPNAAPGYVAPSSLGDLTDEAFALVAASADTTGGVLTTAAYHAISNEHIYRTLSAELKNAFPDPTASLDFLTLEKLPYLTAVIKEGLRLSFGVPGRLPRVTPPPGATFNGYFIPAGTVVGMSSWLMHRNPSIFPNPEKFSPDRWLADSDSTVKLEKYLVPFGKGSRQCIGMPLAYCELYVALGTLFRRFDQLKALEMRPEDFVFDDFFGAYWPEAARKFHVEWAGDRQALEAV